MEISLTGLLETFQSSHFFLMPRENNGRAREQIERNFLLPQSFAHVLVSNYSEFSYNT